jgi:hypothetical protein
MDFMEREYGREVCNSLRNQKNDILKEYIAQKEWIYPPKPSMRIIIDMFEFLNREVPQWNPISVSGYHIREAGSTAIQELAFTLADGFAYVVGQREVPVLKSAGELLYLHPLPWLRENVCLIVGKQIPNDHDKLAYFSGQFCMGRFHGGLSD